MIRLLIPGKALDADFLLRLREAWRLSHVPYVEVAYRSVQASRGSGQILGAEGEGLTRLFAMVMRSAKISKGAFAVFGTIAAGIPFLDFVVTPGPESLVSAISLSLAISLAYIVLYSLQVLPSFSNAEPFLLLQSLPLKEGDFSRVALCSFLRTFDYLALGTGFIQVLAVWFLTGSLLASTLMVVGVVLNVTFASAIALWFSGVFYRNVSRGGRSKKAALGRFFFLITWGFGALSIAFLFDLISYILPYLNSVVGSNSSQGGAVLLIFHPFPISFLISSVVYPSLLPSAIPRGAAISASFPVASIVFFATVAYIPLAFVSGKWTFRLVSKIASGKDVRIIRQFTNDIFLRLRGSLPALILKDFRLAARNPSVAFMYALPFFIVFVISIVTTQFVVMRASAMIASTVVGCSFAVMICSALLSTEAGGLEYTMSLPLRVRQIVNAKSILALMTFIPVPLTLLWISSSIGLSSDLLILIPFLELPAMYAACVAQVSFYVGIFPGLNRANRRPKGFSPMAGGDVKRLMESLALSFAFLVIPIGGYSIIFVLSLSHLGAIVMMMALAMGEFLLALRITMKDR